MIPYIRPTNEKPPAIPLSLGMGSRAALGITCSQNSSKESCLLGCSDFGFAFSILREVVSSTSLEFSKSNEFRFPQSHLRCPLYHNIEMVSRWLTKSLDCGIMSNGHQNDTKRREQCFVTKHSSTEYTRIEHKKN